MLCDIKKLYTHHTHMYIQIIDEFENHKISEKNDLENKI